MEVSLSKQKGFKMTSRKILNQKITIQSHESTFDLFNEISKMTNINFTIHESLSERVNLIILSGQSLNTVLDILCDMNNWEWKLISENNIKITRPIPSAKSDIRYLADDIKMILPGDSFRFLNLTDINLKIENLIDFKKFFLDMQSDFLKNGPISFRSLKTKNKQLILDLMGIPALLSLKKCITRKIDGVHYDMSTKIEFREVVNLDKKETLMSVTGHTENGDVTISTKIRLPSDPK